MSCGAIGKQTYADSTLPEPREAGTFEAVAISFKMDAKKNDRNEHEEKKRPLTSTPLCSRPHSPHSLLFSQSKIILFLYQHWLRSVWQLSTAVGILCHFNHLESKTVATSRTSQLLHQCNAREYCLRYPVCVNLQRFYGTPFASIYRDFTIPRLRQFTEILWCPVCVNLQQCNSQTFYVRRPITVKSL